MRIIATAMVIASIATSAAAQEGRPKVERVAPPIVRETVPALADYTDEVLFADLWKRTDLAPRDRSIVTLTALVAGGHTQQMVGHLNRGLDNGVKPTEVSGLITHLAFYSGWPNAMSAVGVAKEVFDKRGIGADQLVAPDAPPLALDEASEQARAASVQETVGQTAPELAEYTNGVLFGDLWRRSDLSPRDRSLVTVTALIASGKKDQLPFHLKRGLDNGLTETEITGTITHLAFYAGWPNAMSAVPAAKAVFDERRGTTGGAAAN